MQTIITDLATFLQQAPQTWSLTPVDGKSPRRKDWQREATIARDQFAEVYSNGYYGENGRKRCYTGVGLRLGRISGGILAIDLDGISSDKLIQTQSGLEVYEALPKTIAVTSGRPGRSVRLYWVPERYWDVISTHKYKTAVDGEGLEYRWDGTQQVVWGKHPEEGRRYAWLPGCSPDVIEIAECPEWVYPLMTQPDYTTPVKQPVVLPKGATGAAARFQKSFFVRGWDAFERDFSLPCQWSVPIEEVLAPSNRKILQGDYSEGRNDSGIKLARDLIGISNYLDSIGQGYVGDPYQLFIDWCQRCGLDKDNPPRQPENIWKSALKINPKSALQPDFVLGCIRAWVWKENKSTEFSKRTRGKKMLFEADNTVIVEAEQAEDALEEAEAAYLEQSDAIVELSQEILLLSCEIQTLSQTAASDDSLAAREEAKAEIIPLKATITAKKQQMAFEKLKLKNLGEKKKSAQKAWSIKARELRKSEKDGDRVTAFARDWAALNELFDYGTTLRYNQLTQTVEHEGTSLLLEHPMADLSEMFPDHEGNWATGDATVGGIVMFLAKKSSYCPIVEYLETARNKHSNVKHNFLDDLGFKVFGITDPLQNTYLKIALIGSVARAYTPGCKFQYLPILIGRQNQGKSSFIKTLYGEEFASEGFLDMGDKDGLLTIARSWAHELAEIDRSFSAKEAPVMKAFITRQKDTYRAPYARQSKDFPRRTIIWGTTNIDELLTDETGNRRYLIIDIPSETEDGEVNRINLKYIEDNRDKIWAAAVDAVLNGLQPLLTPDELEATETRNQAYRDDDVWTDAIADYVYNHQKVSISEILTNVLKIELGQSSRFDKIRVARVLRSIGWQSKAARVHGVIRKIWVRVREVLEDIPIPSEVMAASFKLREMAENAFKSVVSAVQRSVTHVAPKTIMAAPEVPGKFVPLPSVTLPQPPQTQFRLGDLVRICSGLYKKGEVGRVLQIGVDRVQVSFGKKRGLTEVDYFPLHAVALAG